MWRRSLFAVVLLLFVVDLAGACERCGLFGRRCRYAAASVEYVERYRNDTDVFVVQNNYTQPLVGQGATLYQATGYQALVAPLVDPNRYFSQALELQKAADDASRLRASETTALFQRALELQAPVAERLAAGQAAAMVLDAAGLKGEQRAAATGQAVMIDRDEYGRTRISTLSSEQIAKLTAKVDAATGEAVERVAAGEAAKGGLLGQFCGKCHGLAVAEPKGGLYLGDDANVARAMRAKWFEITRAVSNGDMPPAGAPQPDDGQRAAILNEIEAMIVARGKAGP